MSGIKRHLKWLVIPRMQVRGMNAQPAWWCVAPPGPMAARGLAQALAETALDNGADDLAGIGLVWHHFQPRGEHIRSRPEATYQDFFPHQHRAAALINEDDYASGSKTLSGQPTVRGDGILSMVVAIDSLGGVDLQAIKHRLDTGRFAGGTIVEHAFKLPSSNHQASQRRFQPICKEWSEVRQHIRNGFAFVDRSELIETAIGRGAKDPLDAFLNLTVGARSSFLQPYLAGYYALTDTTQRAMARDGHPHTFVEPLVGPGQLLSLRPGRGIPIWDYATRDDRTFLVQEVDCFGGAKPAAEAEESQAEDFSTSKETS